LRDVGVALLRDVVAPDKIAVEFAACARCAGNHEPAVPVVGQTHQDPRLTLPVLGNASLDLNARYGPGDRRAAGQIGGNRVAIGLWRKREPRQSGNRVVSGGCGWIGGSKICALSACCVDEPVAENGQHLLASA
jgi:hypothetical protein